MAAITTIDLVVHTANVTGAGTDADVYLGLAGREFYVDSSLNDFEQGQNITYTFGANPNVLNAGRQRSDPAVAARHRRPRPVPQPLHPDGAAWRFC